MSELADTNRLLKRGGVWYYVRRVPADLIHLAGKSVVKVSLRTGKKAAAKQRRSLEDVKTDAWFASLGKQQLHGNFASTVAPIPLNASQILEYVRAAVELDDTRSAKELISDGPDDADQLHDMRVDAEQALEMLGNPSDPRRMQLIASFGQAAIEQSIGAGATLELDSSAAEIVRRGLVELYRRKLDRYADRFDRQFHDALFGPPTVSAITLGELADAFLNETRERYVLNGVSKKRLDKVTSHTDVIVEIVGPSTPVSAIGDDQVQLVRSTLARMPSNRSKRFPDRSLADAVAANEKVNGAVLGSTTQGFYLDILRDLMKLAVRKKLVALNPAADARPIKKATVSPSDRRQPFTSDQIREFFTGDFYSRCGPASELPYTKADRAWRFWMPLIMLFSGARPNEIAQLRVCDVRKTETGTWYFDLTGDESDPAGIQVKTASSKRRVPIHPELLKIGFLAFVDKCGHGDDRLFPTLKPNTYGNVAWYAAKRFNEVFLPAEIKVGDRQSLYSLRHNVRDALRRIDAPPSALLAIAGWSPSASATSDDYGDKGDPDINAKWVAGIAYSKLDLSFLHVVAE